MHDAPAPLVTNGARRGCGYRQPGGAYFAVPLGPDGRPIEEFLIDPPVVIDDPTRLGLAPVGVTLIEREGATHVIDIVGREHYPNGGLVHRRGPALGDLAPSATHDRLCSDHAGEPSAAGASACRHRQRGRVFVPAALPPAMSPSVLIGLPAAAIRVPKVWRSSWKAIRWTSARSRA